MESLSGQRCAGPRMPQRASAAGSATQHEKQQGRRRPAL